MRIKIYIFLFIALLTSCVDRSLDAIIDNNNETGAVGKEIVCDFSIHIPEHQVVSTRSGEDITELYLLVFDENGRFLSRNKAIMEATQNIDGVVVRKFKVVLLSSDKKRSIHFVANYDNWENFPATHEILHTDEGSVIPRMKSAETTYWGRFDFNMLEETSFDNKRFPLLRNKAKIEVEIDLFEDALPFEIFGFAVYNAPALGTVAPFKYDEAKKEFSFTEGSLTEVSPVELVTPAFLPWSVDQPQSIELFEKDNQLASNDSKVFVVIEGSLNGADPAYFKLDILKEKTNGVLYDVVRNHIYTFKIKSVASNGYSTPEAAAANPAANNVLASVELKDYPSISDGISYLRIEKSYEVFIHPDTFITQIDYFPDLTNRTDTAPGVLDVSWVVPEGELAPSSENINFEYNSTTGEITVIVIKLPTDRVITHTIKVASKASENNGIFRYITLVLRTAYDFNFSLESEIKSTTTPGGPWWNPYPPVTTITKPQNYAVTISFDVPSTIPLNVFPIPIYFQTKELYPNPAYREMDVNIYENIYRYEYKIKEADRGETVTLHFKRTNSDKTESIPIVCQYLPATTSINLD